MCVCVCVFVHAIVCIHVCACVVCVHVCECLSQRVHVHVNFCASLNALNEIT